jgi:hypothetical protein
LRFRLNGGRRLYLALGHERDGWTRELAHVALLVAGAAGRAQPRPALRLSREG